LFLSAASPTLFLTPCAQIPNVEIQRHVRDGVRLACPDALADQPDIWAVIMKVCARVRGGYIYIYMWIYIYMCVFI
jgi:hypothetical protein